MAQIKMIFSRLTQNVCWICDSPDNLTGEHKIKKSDLQRHPGTIAGVRRVNSERFWPVQGLNSKLLKFESAICADCNNRKTQQADRSYDAFKNEGTKASRTTLDEMAAEACHHEEQGVDLSGHIELVRYFAKHLGCAIDAQRLPVPRRLSRFVAGHSNTLCISLKTRTAPRWFKLDTGKVVCLNALGAAFVLRRAGSTQLPLAYQSAYMTDGKQFIVKMDLTLTEALEIRFLYSRKIGKPPHEFDNEDAALRGLPYED